jgi:hypothetical protein
MRCVAKDTQKVALRRHELQRNSAYYEKMFHVEQIRFDKFVEWAFMSMISGGVGLASLFLFRMAKGVSLLNLKIATIIERIQWHEREIIKSGEEIERIKQQLLVKRTR